MLIVSHYVWHIKPEFNKWNTFRCWDICSKQLEDACIEINIANEININLGTSEYFEDFCIDSKIDIDVYILIAMLCHCVILFGKEFRLYNIEIRKCFWCWDLISIKLLSFMCRSFNIIVFNFIIWSVSSCYHSST